MRVYYRYSFITLISLVYLLFLYFKLSLGELTPDENLFISGQIPMDNWSLKYTITLIIISTLSNINELLYPFILIFVSVFTFNQLYRIEFKERVLGNTGVLITFLLPSTIYFSTAYLRDILLYLLALLLIYSYHQKKVSFWTVIFFGLIVILRPEAGILILLSYLFVYIFSRNEHILLSINKYTSPLVIIFSWLLLILLISTDIFWEYLYNTINEYEKSTVGFSVFQVPITHNNIISLGLVNWFAYYAPFFFKDSFSLFGYFMLIDSIIVGLLFIRGIFFINKNQFKYDKIYQVSYFLVLATLFISLPESLPETMYRHRMAYLPFLLYLNFSRIK